MTYVPDLLMRECCHIIAGMILAVTVVALVNDSTFAMGIVMIASVAKITYIQDMQWSGWIDVMAIVAGAAIGISLG